jgi:hypothetical protein
VGLHKNKVSTPAGACGWQGRPGPTPEMLKAHLKEIRRTGVACNMPAQLPRAAIGAYDHGQRVPSNQGGDALL